MASLVKVLDAVKVPYRRHKGLSKMERELGIIADVQIENEHVYLLYHTYLPLEMIFEQLSAPKTPVDYAVMFVYGKNGYWYETQTGLLLAEAIKKCLCPRIYALLQPKH